MGGFLFQAQEVQWITISPFRTFAYFSNVFCFLGKQPKCSKMSELSCISLCTQHNTQQCIDISLELASSPWGLAGSKHNTQCLFGSWQGLVVREMLLIVLLLLFYLFCCCYCCCRCWSRRKRKKVWSWKKKNTRMPKPPPSSASFNPMALSRLSSSLFVFLDVFFKTFGKKKKKKKKKKNTRWINKVSARREFRYK